MDKGGRDNKIRATELEWLVWFYVMSPLSEYEVNLMKKDFMKKTGKLLPMGYFLPKD